MQKFLHITNKTFQDFGVQTEQELWTKVKGDYQGLAKPVTLAFEKKAETNEITMVMSTSDEDRHGDIVEQEWDLKWFKKNPVLLDSHNYDSITHIIGRVKNARVENGKLVGEVEFATDNPKGLLASQMVEKGFLVAGSVGFIPKEFNDKGAILKSELLEYSLVSVPANPRALLEKNVEEPKQEEAPAEEVPPVVEAEVKVIKSEKQIDKTKLIANSIGKLVREMDRKNLEETKRKILIAVRTL